ncbi:MAG: hypothetical protein F6K58_21870 [Symploca sp. SIO2E9]|nr:hypothetical protein [Symploca sp. SIO2E9]
MVRLREIKNRASGLLENAVERLENSGPIQGLLPLTNPNNYSFTADLNWVSPWDCENNPNSPFCGGRPWSIPLGFRFQFAQDDCNTSVEFNSTIFSGRGPQIHFNYRDPNCFVEQPFPPFPIENLEEEEEQEEGKDEPPEEPPFNYNRPGGKFDDDDPPKCNNNCGPLFQRYLREQVVPLRRLIKERDRRDKTFAERDVEFVFKSPAAPGSGQSYCDRRRDELYAKRHVIGDFISPQYWDIAEPENESGTSISTRYLRIFEAYNGEIETRTAFYRDGHWKGVRDNGTTFNLSDCSCLVKMTTKRKKTVLGRYITRQCYPIVYKPFPLGGKVLGTADIEPTYIKTDVSYDFFTIEESGLPPVFNFGAPFPDEPEPPPPFVRKRCRKSCSCTKDLSPVMSGILAQLNQIKARLQEDK